LQGDTLAPFLFVIVLDYVLSQLSPGYGFKSHILPETILEDLDFADDIALLDEDSESEKSHLSSIMIQASHVGLKVNMPKTKCMAFPPLTTGITLDNGT